jgi:oligopeptide transport system substrate-binding protein
MNLLKQWRYILLTVLAIVALGALAACGDDDDDDDTGESATPTRTGALEGERIDGGTLTVQYLEPQSLDPHFSSFAQDIGFQRMLWRGLYHLDQQNEVEPGMAADMPVVSEDGKTFTVTLRSGLKWSDGDDLTADDFVLGIQRTCNPINAGEYQYVLTNIVGCDDYYNALSGPDGDAGTGDDLDPATADLSAFQDAVGVTAVDDTTVEFQLINPGPTFPTILSLWMTFPVPAHLLPDPGEPWPAGPDAPGALAYNGPYQLTGYVAGSSATMEPNTNWAGDLKPTLDELELRFIDDFAVATRAYEAGEIDVTNVDLTQLQSLVDTYEPDGLYLKAVGASSRGLEMNLEHPPLDNLDVRLAIGKAIDFQTMIDNCFSGGHEYTTTWIPEEIAAGQPTDFQEDLYAFDVTEAQQMLADAGFPGGQGVPELVIVVRQGAETECVGQFIQEALRANLGVNVKIDAVEAPVRSARFREETFDLYPGGWVQDYPDPENWTQGLFDEGGSLNHYNCNNPEINDLLSKAFFNLNEEERISQYEQVNELIVTQVCGIFPYYHEALHFLKTKEAVGLFETSSSQNAVIAGDWAAEAWGVTE